MNKFLRLNREGEAGGSTGGTGGSEGGKGEGGEAAEVKKLDITQEQLNDIVAAERKRTAEKYGDYETVKEKVAKMEADEKARAEKSLEEKGEYEKLKEQMDADKATLQQQIDASKLENQNLRIKHSLDYELSKQNAQPDTSKLIQDKVSVDENGNVSITMKVNGVDQKLSVEDGVKAFLAENKYLVKANGQGGAGSSAGEGSGDGSGQGGDQTDLGTQLQVARRAGDLKKVAELKTQIRAKHGSSLAI